MIWLEIAKAGVFTMLGGILGFFLGPPIEQMNGQRANCRAIVEAENDILAFVANPARIPDLGAAIDSKVHIIRAKAGSMGVNALSSDVPLGPGIAAVKDFMIFAEKNAYGPAPNVLSKKHVEMINAVQKACELQFSSLRSIPWNVLGLW